MMAELEYGGVFREDAGKGLVAPSVFVASVSSSFVREIVPSEVKHAPLFGKREIPTYLPAGVNPLTADMRGVIRGRVREDGLPVAGRIVRAYFRSNGYLTKEVLADTSGNFEITGLYVGGMYYVLSLDDLSTPPVYNAVISDQVTPIID